MSQKLMYAIILIASIPLIHNVYSWVNEDVPTTISPSISGYLNLDGKSLANVTVIRTISSDGLEIVHNTTTNTQGHFEFGPTTQPEQFGWNGLDRVDQQITVLYMEQARPILSITSTYGLHKSIVRSSFLDHIHCNISPDASVKPYLFSPSRYDVPVMLESLCKLNT